MAVTLADRFVAAADLMFQKRVAEAAAEAAVNIYAELVTTPGHAARALYATAVLNDPPLSLISNGEVIQPHARQYAFALAIATQGIDSTSTDAQIATAVAAVWNALAGA